MGKEVKLGLAIGGILLSVLLVYILVVSGNPVAPEQVTLELPAHPAVAEATVPPATPEPVAKPVDPVTPPPVEITPSNPEPSSALAENTPEVGPDPWIKLLSEGMTLSTETPQSEQPTTIEPIRTGPPLAQIPPKANQPVIPPGNGANEPVANSNEARTHVVRSGETYSSIAAAAYGSSAYFAHLVRANPGVDPAKLRPGMVINIPPESQVRADHTPRADQARVLDDRAEYRVQGGDSLYKISMSLYGKPDRQDKIYDANKATIGADKTKLRPGQVLKLPEPPTATRSQ